MRKKALLMTVCVIVVVASIVGLSFLHGHRLDKPRVVVIGQSVYECGTLGIEDMRDGVKALFTIRNVGRKDLTIWDIKVEGCQSCFDVDLDQTNIKPGELCDVRVTYHPKWQAGHWAKRIALVTNDVENELVEFAMKGECYFECRAVPPRVDIRDLLCSGEKEVQVKIIGRSGEEDFHVRSAECANPNVATRSVRRIESDEYGDRIVWEVVVVVKGQGVPVWKDSLLIHASGHREDQVWDIEVPVAVRELGKYQVTPSMLFLSSTSIKAHTVHIVSNGASEVLDPLDVSAPDWLDVELDDSSGSELRLTIHLKREPESTALVKGDVKLSLKNGDIITVPVLLQRTTNSVASVR